MNPSVVISVFGLFHPSELDIAPAHPAEPVTIRCEAKTTRLEGRHSMRLASGCETNGRFILSVPGKIRREFAGSLRIAPGLTALITMDLETAVASVVAAELPRDAPPAALEAQAIAARSYYAASNGRHAFAAYCDSTHCQHIRGVLAQDHPATRAAQATRGLVLDYDARIVMAMYSASCSGRRQTGVANADGYPYVAVECAYCRRTPTAKPGLHERGLCQSGAVHLAKQGKIATEILMHYYPGTSLKPLR